MSGVEGLRLTLQTAAGRSFRGDLCDLSLLGAGARFGGEHVPKMNPGDVVTLQLESNTDAGSVSVKATVRSVFWISGYERYGFEFEDAEAVRASQASRWFLWLSRRRSPRATLAEEEAVAVRLRAASGVAWQGRMVDISAGGIRLWVDGTTDPGSGASFKITFRLPRNRRLLSLWADLRRCEASAGGTLLSFEFDSERTERFRTQTEMIQRFVVSRLSRAPSI
jgi:c-di-GMP-binding flagellar brake protein YcgR